jgi:hypothetical protein
MPSNNPRVRRIGLIRVSETDEGVRRYLLARLDEISLATPAQPAKPALRQAASAARTNGSLWSPPD